MGKIFMSIKKIIALQRVFFYICSGLEFVCGIAIQSNAKINK